MERKNKIGISFDASYFSQVFIHTAGAYMDKPISKNNNKYLANLRTIPPDERFGRLVLELENATSEAEKEKIINKLKQIAEINKTVQAIPLTFKDNIEDLMSKYDKTSNSDVEDELAALKGNNNASAIDDELAKLKEEK